MFAGISDTSVGPTSSTASTEFVELSPPDEESLVESMRVEEGQPEQGEMAFADNPTAALVARLFQEREYGGIIEIHLTGGSMFAPEFYEARWSVGSHALFASRAADDTVTLTAVAWDAIQRIVVRQVNGLPEGMF